MEVDTKYSVAFFSCCCLVFHNHKQLCNPARLGRGKEDGNPMNRSEYTKIIEHSKQMGVKGSSPEL